MKVKLSDETEEAIALIILLGSMGLVIGFLFTVFSVGMGLELIAALGFALPCALFFGFVFGGLVSSDEDFKIGVFKALFVSMLGAGLGCLLGFNSFIGFDLLLKTQPYWLLIPLLILTELLFYFEKSKPSRHDNVLLFTLKRKVINFLVVAVLILQLYGLPTTFQELVKFIGLKANEISFLIFVVGVIVIILGVAFAWIKINSLKYSKKQKKGSRGK